MLTAKLLIDHVFKLHNLLVEIVSDRSPQFLSQVWKAFCSAVGDKVHLSSGCHPQNNGETERLNQEVEAALCCVASQNVAS